MPASSILKKLKEAKRDRRRKQAVSAVIGGVIMFAILFTVGFGYFYTTSQQLKEQTSLASEKAQESFQVTGYADSVNTSNTDIQIEVENNGPIAITIETIIITYMNSTGSALSTFTISSSSNDISSPTLPISINSGSSEEINTGVLAPTGYGEYYAVKVISQRGTVETWSTTGTNLTNIAGIAEGLGSFGLIYDSFKFYYATGYQYGDGYQTGGYDGFEVPSGQSVVFQLEVTNYDPDGRSMTIDDRSAIWLPATTFFSGSASCVAGSSNDGYYWYSFFNYGNSGQCLYIVGDLINNATGCTQNINQNFYYYYDYYTINNAACVGANAFRSLTVPYGATVLLNFSASLPGCPSIPWQTNTGDYYHQQSSCSTNTNWWDPGQLGVRGDTPVFLLLFGSYSDNTLFGQNIPFVSTYGTIAMIQPTYQPGSHTPCPDGSGSEINGYCVGTNAIMTAGNTIVDVAQGGTYYLNLVSFNSTTSVWFVNSNGQIQNITDVPSQTQPTFTIPTTATPGQYYTIYAFDGINSAYATVLVWGGITTITTTLHSSSIVVGSTDYDAAALSGLNVYTPTGTVQYQYFTGTSSCSGSPTNSYIVGLSNGNIPNSPTVTFTSANSYSWQAIYSGDSNYMGSTSSCESLTVNLASPSLSTQTFSPSPPKHDTSTKDTVTLSGGYNPTGTITFTYYTNSACSGSGYSAGSDTVNGNGAYSLTWTTTHWTSSGTYSVQASYGGDSNNNAVSQCTSVSVS